MPYPRRFGPSRKRRRFRQDALSETHEWEDALWLVKRANEARNKDEERAAAQADEGEGTERGHGD